MSSLSAKLPIGGRRQAAHHQAPRRGDKTALEHPFLSLPAVGFVLIGFCLPIGVLFVYSFWPTTLGGQILTGHWTLSNYGAFFTNTAYWQTLLDSFLFVSIAAALAVALTFPFAYFVALRVRPQRRMVWVVIAILPFSTSYLIRIFAWFNLLGSGGIINQALLKVHLISSPLGFLGYGRPGIVLTFIYLLFPLSFLTSYVAVERLDPALLDSASDLGARPWRAFIRIVLPVARTGLLAAFAFCFITMMGDYVTPVLIGGTSGTLFVNLAVNDFGFSQQWGLGSALAFIMLASILVFLVIARRSTGATQSVGEFSRAYIPRRSILLRIYSVVFLFGLYLPIALVVLLAFNSSEFVGFPISGLTTHWFTTALTDPALLSALRTSLTVVAWALSISLVVGTLAAVQLARTRGLWRSLSIGTLALPLVLPPVMLGLGVIISLHAVGVTRGLWTIIAAHTLLVLPVVTFIVMVRLEGLDANFERAAMDLGAKPWQAFLYVTVPQALPGIIAAALIGFALSIDEFIVTYLVTGTQVTLPLYIYSSIRYNITPELNALSSMLLATSFILCGLAAVVLRRGRRRRSPDAATAPASLDLGVLMP